MMLVGWTTTASREEAEKLAAEAVDRRLAACCQIDGPIRSVYRWEGAVEQAEEYRITFKFLEQQASSLEEWLLQNHPYENPQWLAVPAERISQKYLIWAEKGAN